MPPSRHEELLIHIRKLYANEAELLSRHLCRLSGEDRSRRFMGGLTHAAVDQYCRRLDWLRAVVMGYFEEGTLRGAAELQLADAHFPIVCEVALTVETAWQERGIATELMRRTLIIARNRWARCVRVICLGDNHRIQHVAHKFGARFHTAGGESTGEIAVAPPTAASLCEEAIDDGFGWFAAAMDPLKTCIRSGAAVMPGAAHPV